MAKAPFAPGNPAPFGGFALDTPPAGGGGAPGSPSVSSVKVVLNNSQIQALPNGVTLIPASPSFDRLYVPIHVDILMQGQGAYANVATPVWLNLFWSSFNEFLLGTATNFDPAVSYPSFPALKPLDCRAMFTLVTRKYFTVLSVNAPILANADSGNLSNNALNLFAVNGSPNNGNFTGGNANNTMTVYVYYNELLF